MKLQRRLFKQGTLVSIDNLLIASKPSSHGILLTITNNETHEELCIEQRFLTTTCEYHFNNGLVITHYFSKIPATIELSKGMYKQDKNCIHYLNSSSCLNQENAQVLIDVDYQTLIELGVLIVLNQLVRHD